MKKITVKSPANIALVKYWAKADNALRIPINNSISMCLSDMFSITTAQFDTSLSSDSIYFENEAIIQPRELKRITTVLDRVRKKAGMSVYAKIVTKNNFPKAVGIASSASGFSSLCMSLLLAAGVVVSKKELSVFCRLASGTACRSIPDGFVEWVKGSTSDSSYAREIFPPDYLDIYDLVVVVSKTMKKVSSTDGHAFASTSPFYRKRLDGVGKKIKDIKNAIRKKDFSRLGQIAEAEALNMHAICFTSIPPIIYWEAPTIEVMRKVVSFREEGIESYYTIDAGPSVHVLCEKKNVHKLSRQLEQIRGVKQVVINKPGKGAHVINNHLF